MLLSSKIRCRCCRSQYKERCRRYQDTSYRLLGGCRTWDHFKSPSPDSDSEAGVWAAARTKYLQNDINQVQDSDDHLMVYLDSVLASFLIIQLNSIILDKLNSTSTFEDSWLLITLNPLLGEDSKESGHAPSLPGIDRQSHTHLPPPPFLMNLLWPSCKLLELWPGLGEH